MMKYLISILLIVISLNCFGQYSQQKQRRDNWVRLGLFTGSIVLNAVGDGLNNSSNKEWGHICNAASIGLTLSIPLIIDIDKSKWFYYLAEYAFIRFAIFDYAHNLAAGLPYNYIGSTSYYDQILKGQDLAFPKVLSLTVGIAFNFNEFNK